MGNREVGEIPARSRHCNLEWYLAQGHCRSMGRRKLLCHKPGNLPIHIKRTYLRGQRCRRQIVASCFNPAPAKKLPSSRTEVFFILIKP